MAKAPLLRLDVIKKAVSEGLEEATVDDKDKERSNKERCACGPPACSVELGEIERLSFSLCFGRRRVLAMLVYAYSEWILAFLLWVTPPISDVRGGRYDEAVVREMEKEKEMAILGTGAVATDSLLVIGEDGEDEDEGEDEEGGEGKNSFDQLGDGDDDDDCEIQVGSLKP